MSRTALAQPDAQPAALAISSHVACGSVGNRAMVFALEALGVETRAVATVSLPFHPGHGPAPRIVPPAEEFGRLLASLIGHGSPPDVVVSGYFADPAQVDAVAAHVAELKRRNPATRYLCDPVIGDRKGLYVADGVAKAIFSSLLPLADVATPNRFELALLAGGQAPSTIAETVVMARRLGPPSVVITSAPALMRGAIANLLVGRESAFVCEHRLVDGPANGPGDLAAGIFAGHLARGLAGRGALEKMTASIHDMMLRSAGSAELRLAGNAGCIVAPNSAVAARDLRPAGR
jgi:pyridoxine kinase